MSLRTLLDTAVRQVSRVETACNRAAWDLEMTGSDEAAARVAEAERELRRLQGNPELFAALKAQRQAGSTGDLLLDRVLEVVYLQWSLPNQLPPETTAALVDMSVKLTQAFNTFRPTFQGRRVSDNDLREVLRQEQDSEVRRAAWEATKQVGRAVAPLVLEAVRLRNSAARSLGFANHAEFSLVQEELSPAQLFAVMDPLKEMTDAPWREEKAAIDRELAERFGVPANAIMPWHYADPFFQEVPAGRGGGLSELGLEVDPVAISTRFYDSLGLDVHGVLARSDLYERENKNPHAFCSDIDRSGDVRICCNLKPTPKWLSTMLHELGHAVYDLNIDPGLPYPVRIYGHLMTTEAIAILMESVLFNPAWLMRYVGITAKQAEQVERSARQARRRESLIFARWGLQMVYFERELYQNPEQDLGKAWWDLEARTQLLPTPPGERAYDWASKIHIATSPVYYHNYLFGHMIAAQLQHALTAEFGRDWMVDNPAAGRWLVERWFRPGRTLTWQEKVQNATGEPLNPRYWVEEMTR